ncbi:UNVERIFIED_CONTAM: hypothetical protein Sradi_3247400 [Sesamum radiatum]|uniref:Tf2-1-like SH3-like domain-containing protein n=1 Tax=Sesamum radiatum TaxID=300843 RepID=A0AAW2QZJ7_SESRA
MQKYVTPLPIIRRIGTLTYKIELPSWWKIHNVFHVSRLKKYLANKKDNACNQPKRPQLELMKTKEKVTEAILNHRVIRTAKREHTEYLVKGKGCSSEENIWGAVALCVAISAAHCAGVGGLLLLSGGISRLLRTSSHTVPFSPHCGRRLVTQGRP